MIAAEQKTRIPPYVLIVGQGRSGTNWLLELLDLSPRTHCRNEPNEIDGALFAKLPSPHLDRPMPPQFAERWDEAVSAASRTMGERDRHVMPYKQYAWETMRLVGGRQLVMKERTRRVLSVVHPALRRREWGMPWWLGRQSAMQQALPVLKFTQTPGWACWVLRNRPEVPVIHIVRHPAGFLNSWVNRYLAKLDRGVVRRENEARLREIAAVDRDWARRFGDIAEMTVEQSELWYWIYANEVLYNIGRRLSGYMHVVYERVVSDPLAMTRKMFERCGLQTDQAIERGVKATTVESKAIGAQWQEQLSADQVSLVERMLGQSIMRGWWSRS